MGAANHHQASFTLAMSGTQTQEQLAPLQRDTATFTPGEPKRR